MSAFAQILAMSACGGVMPGCGGASASTAQSAVSDPLDTVDGAELFRRGLALAAAEDYVRAEQYLVASMERGHPEDDVMMPLVSACVRSDRLSAALRYAEPYLARHPGAWTLRLVVATVQMAIGDPESARREFVRVTEDAPTHPAAHYMLAVLERDVRHDPAAAALHFQRYIEVDPEGEHVEEARSALAHPAAPAVPVEAGEPVRLTPRAEAERSSAAPGGVQP